MNIHHNCCKDQHCFISRLTLARFEDEYFSAYSKLCLTLISLNPRFPFVRGKSGHMHCLRMHPNYRKISSVYSAENITLCLYKC